ncbi:MAG: FecR domain-containing protein [Burkholderiaceae bacterium]|nr:FecR domain-containing protein [Burkholderiaceae bacterium]
MTANDLIESQAADWLARKDGERWTPEQQQALDDWLAASTLHRVAYLRLDSAWQRADRLRALQSAERPQPVMPQVPAALLARPWVRRSLGGLGGLAIALMAWVLVGDFNLAKPDTEHYATAVGKREAVALADGSRLTLNTATRVRTAVTAQERRVWLDQGEAFFDVAHDASRPFVVIVGTQRVTVLGTKFSLRRDGERLRVAVLEGRVKVQSDGAQATVLTREDAAVADARNLLVTKKTPQQLQASLSWLQGKLIFDQISLAEAAQQFNRYSHRQLVIADPAAAQIRIGGSFDAGNVEAFARLLHVGFGLEVQLQGDEIRISSPAS